MTRRARHELELASVNAQHRPLPPSRDGFAVWAREARSPKRAEAIVAHSACRTVGARECQLDVPIGGHVESVSALTIIHTDLSILAASFSTAGARLAVSESRGFEIWIVGVRRALAAFLDPCHCFEGARWARRA